MEAICCVRPIDEVRVYDIDQKRAVAYINTMKKQLESKKIDEEIVVKADKICVDSLEGALEEAGDLIIPINKGLIRKQDIFGENRTGYWW